MDKKTLGEIAYDAASLVSPVPAVPWPEANHEKWEAAAQAVADACVPRKDIDERSGLPMHETCINGVHRVYFRAGLIACREWMGRLLEPQSHAVAALVRMTWWPGLGPDPGKPRKNEFAELAVELGDGTYVPAAVNPSIEALPIALAFIEAGERERDELAAAAARAKAEPPLQPNGDVQP